MASHASSVSTTNSSTYGPSVSNVSATGATNQGAVLIFFNDADDPILVEDLINRATIQIRDFYANKSS